ncbi:MAG: deoxyribonuclease/rho motif-related [Myxococcales bacterium]|nr:deoxyribonuclease/rho motif-related [Myxococcales bacterium]
MARDPGGRVTFVPNTVPGDRVRVGLVKETKSFARGELVEVLAPSPSRVEPPCEYFRAGCGGCQWQHVARAAQLEAKQAIVANALRNIAGLAIERIADPAPPLGWRRRARFHVVGGRVGLYANASHRLIPLAHCPQLEPALEPAFKAVASVTPPDGELAFVRGHRGEIVVGLERSWRGAPALIGRAGIVGVIAGDDVHGETVIEIEPDLYGGPWDFAQASAAGNRALIAATQAALGPGPGRLLELYAGAGNFTRGFVAAGWDVTATDVEPPRKPIARARFISGAAQWVLGKLEGMFDAIVLDPPRTGAAEAIDGIVKISPKTIVYVSCDPATLARDVARLVTAGYRAERAWPFDLMPQTSHVEVVLRLTLETPAT